MDPGRKLEIEIEATRALIRAFELSGDYDLLNSTIEGETDLYEAIDRVLAELTEVEMLITGIVPMRRALSDRESRLKTRMENLRAMLEQALTIAELKTLRRPAATLTLIDREPGLVIEDEAAIPSQYFKPGPPQLDRTKLKEALADHEIAGARLSQGTVSLMIRRV